MRRRDLLALPAVAFLPAPGSRPVHRLRLNSDRPLAEFASLWAARGWPAPVRIVARPRPGWWPAPDVLPDAWSAWLDLPCGAAVVVERRSAAGCDDSLPASPPARALVAALTSAASWPA